MTRGWDSLSPAKRRHQIRQGTEVEQLVAETGNAPEIGAEPATGGSWRADGQSSGIGGEGGQDDHPWADEETGGCQAVGSEDRVMMAGNRFFRMDRLVSVDNGPASEFETGRRCFRPLRVVISQDRDQLDTPIRQPSKE